MWPSPRPDSCGTATPNAATSGASGSVILSPTPPVECLSTVGLPRPAKLIRSPEAIIASVSTRISSRSMPLQEDRHRERRHLRVGDVAARVGVDHPAQRVLGHGAAVALGADDVDRVERLDGMRSSRRLSRSRGPNASGSTSSIVRMPDTVSSSMPGTACSYSSWRQRPHGMSVLAVAVDAHEGDELARRPTCAGR